jgi:molybdenum cofactor biosynthesis protein MoaC
MRDVSAKNWTLRTAAAKATVACSPESITLIQEGRAPKGDPRPIARVAAVMAAKNTPQLIPYCHSVALDWVGVEFEMLEDRIEVTVRVKAIYKTGVEMEALAGAAAAALNLYDLLKPVDEELMIERIELLEKTGGKSNARAFASGEWTAAVLVCSDRASSGEYADRSGRLLVGGLEGLGGRVIEHRVIADEAEQIQTALTEWVGEGVDIIFVSGGSGIAARDITPETVEKLLDRRLPGVEARFRSYSMDRVPTAMLSRAIAGVSGSTVVVTLPGSPGAAQDALDSLFPYLLHAREVLRERS